MEERSLIRMAVMSRNVNLSFEVAPEKKDLFLKTSVDAKAFERAMERAARNMKGFGGIKTTKK